MGLMDRDYYREKPRKPAGKKSPLGWVKENPALAGVIALLLLLLLLYLL
ncbi:hypothetical protein [Hydrogenivirga sp.]